MTTAIKIENVSKQYRLGQIGTGTLSHDLNRWWTMNILRKEDPFLKVGEINDRSKKATSKYVWALRDINLEMEQGDVIGIIGKNGAGKSTLLKILSRVTKPTTGYITYKGRIASLLEVGTGFHPEMTGRENIYMNGSIMGMTRAEITRKLDEIIAFAGVERYIDTPTKRYSSGMTVRLGFAIAAHLDPEILVVDEVLAVGDAEFQKKAIGKMQDVSKGEGRTVLFVSHNMASIQNLCTKGIILTNGCVTYNGNIEATITTYLAESKALSTSNLLERQDRKGGEIFKFTEVSFFDSDTNEQLNTLISGSNIKIQFRYETELPVGSTLSFGISFFTQQGAFLFGCNNNYLNIRLKVIQEKKSTCYIKSFPLDEGTYNYNIIAVNDNNVVDYLLDAGSIDVVSGDFFKTGKTTPKGRPGVLVNFKWI